MTNKADSAFLAALAELHHANSDDVVARLYATFSSIGEMTDRDLVAAAQTLRALECQVGEDVRPVVIQLIEAVRAQMNRILDTLNAHGPLTAEYHLQCRVFERALGQPPHCPYPMRDLPWWRRMLL